MEEKIGNTIAKHQQIINELKLLLLDINNSDTKNIRFRIETKQWHGYSEPFLKKDRHILNLSKDAMQSFINFAIEKEEERINKYIDMEIEKRIEKKKEGQNNDI